MQRANTPGNRLKEELPLFFSASLVVILDQLSKLVIRLNMSPGQSIPEEGVLRLTYVTNTGGAFGLFANQTFLIALTAAIGAIVILLYYRYPPFHSTLVKTGLGLMLGGAVGNLIDRIRLGCVIDFLNLGGWPVFNLADSAIVIGASITTCLFLFKYRKIQKGKH